MLQYRSNGQYRDLSSKNDVPFSCGSVVKSAAVKEAAISFSVYRMTLASLPYSDSLYALILSPNENTKRIKPHLSLQSK
ncbi:MAG: hypothetical protein LBU32_16940 [Clostridiales bacterium]|nr:hypothetical protein [Clostridiales bacterium]